MSKEIRALLFSALVVMYGMPAFALTLVNEGNSSRNSSAELPAAVGVKAGIFAKHGLNVQVHYFQGGSKLFQAMTAGSIDIGVSAGPEMALIARGAPMLAVCNVAPPVAFIGVTVPAGSSIHNVAELKGKRIGVSSAFSLTHWLTEQLAEKEGWGKNGVSAISIGNSNAALVSAFRTHAVDAVMASTLFGFELEAHHQGHLLIQASKFEGNLAAGTVYATKQFISKHPDAVRRFLAAWFQTVDFMRQHKAEAIKIESQITLEPLGVQAKEFNSTFGMFSNSCTFDAESLANLKRSFIDMKLLRSVPKMSTLYTTAFMPKQ